ncbi:MAG: transglutaminase domain-containing protein [Cyanobacteria bacterium J06621_8]
MSAKGRSQNLKSLQKKKQHQLNVKLIISAIAVSLLVTIANINHTISTWQSQQLILIDSETFASHKYLPIKFGSADKILEQDFSEIDSLAKQLRYSGTSVVELANLLEQHAATEAAKARIIYAWITQHIAYDVSAFNQAIDHDIYPEVSPEQVLEQRKTICSGFSNLYYALASAMNLDSVIIIGYAKGATPENDPRFQEINHAWNGVKIDQGWYLIDATWGAGSIVNNQFIPQFKPYYFATAPQEFIKHHYPQDSGWQLIAPTLTRQNFNDFPPISERFYDLGLAIVSHQNYQIETAQRVEIKLQAPPNVVVWATMSRKEQELSESTVLVSRHDHNIVINAAPPQAGTYDLTIFAKEQNDSPQYDQIIKYKIAADNSVAQLPITYAPFNDYQASLLEPLEAELKPNWSTYFALVVPEAIDVQVVNSDTQQWTSLTGYGNQFRGNVDIQPGNIFVVAKFPDEDQYWQLLKYQAD